MSNCAIVGINWGDEGKGRMVDYFAGQFPVVVRYQGGNNAGHTVVNEYGKFALNLLPSGIFHSGTLNLLGAGVVVDLKHIHEEIGRLRDKGVAVSPDNLRISDRAIMVLPIHPAQDKWEEQRLGKAHFGSTLRGISPIYGDKYMKKALQMGDLKHPKALEEHLRRLIDCKNDIIVKGYGQPPISYDETLEWIHTYGDPLIPYVCDAGELLENAQAAGKSIMFEAQLGALRDINYGIYPFTSSSSPLAANAPVGCGLPSAEGRRGRRRDEGVLHLRRRGPVRRRARRRGRRQAARGRRGIWRRHRPPAPRGVDGYRGHALWHEAAGRDRAGADEDGRAVLSGRDPRLRRL